ncbi:hypothetical protein HaLaN_27584 [Haematococcus lacustris]|uniref:Uncharacterized protein n=1 Tax=Haematococcus lacustris TaxID=44745 RepID=A0A6A0A8H4_HAELA|nr:hypothetical protein HaLaN_27584 [Haematococcus lacustris]
MRPGRAKGARGSEEKECASQGKVRCEEQGGAHRFCGTVKWIGGELKEPGAQDQSLAGSHEVQPRDAAW